MAPDVSVRPMQRLELDIALEWAAREGWNPGLSDAECFWRADPGGFFLAEQEGRMVGAVSAVVYPGGFAFGGLFLVLPELRNQGIGRAMIQAVLPRVEGMILGQDGVVAMQDTYRAMGFELAHQNIRWKTTGGGNDPGGLADLRDVDFGQVEALDLPHFKYPRPAFLKAWINQPRAAALGVMDGGKLTAMGVIRPCREGWKIGPLFAPGVEEARRVLAGLLARAPGETVYLDTPQPNAGAREMVRERKMEEVFETGRMYLNGDPGLPLERIFGITTFELG